MAWRILQPAIRSVAKYSRTGFQLMIAGSQQQTYWLGAGNVFVPYIWMVAVIYKAMEVLSKDINAVQTYQLIQHRYHHGQILICILFAKLQVYIYKKQKNHVSRSSPIISSLPWYVAYHRTKHHSIPPLGIYVSITFLWNCVNGKWYMSSYNLDKMWIQFSTIYISTVHKRRKLFAK